MENIVIASMKASLSFSGDTAELIICMPTMRIAKPRRIFPRFLWTVRLDSIRSSVPAMAAAALMVAEDKIAAIPLEPCMYERHRTHPVILVPIFDPRTMAMA